LNSPQTIELQSPEKRSTDSERTISETVDSALCAADLKHFASKHAIIQNQNNQKIEKWQDWQYLLDLIDIILEYDVTYIVKASQLGVSWLMAIISDWYANFGETAKCLLLSQGQTEAQDLLSKLSFVHENLPAYLRLPIDKDNREMFALKGNHAEIRALPSTEKAGHGFQGSLVVRDELARHENARENYRAVARSGAKLVELSTANKKDPTNYFGEKTEEFWLDPLTEKRVYPSGLELYTNEKKPGVCLVFLSWKLRPTRVEGMTLDEWWDSRILPRYTAEEIEEQFPEKIEDVFKASITRAYFEFSALDDMGYDICPPMRQDTINTYNNVIRVYKLPIVGRRYIIFTDPSDGVGDPFVTGCMDYVTGELVASATGKEKVDRVAEIHDYLVREYGNASNTFEYTGSVGGTMWKVLDDLKTPNQAPRRKPDGKIDEGKKGQWVSSEHKERNFGHLAFGIAKRKYVIHDREFMRQAKMVQRENEKPIMDKKQTYDWVMMMVGLGQLEKFMPPTDAFKITSSKYKD